MAISYDIVGATPQEISLHHSRAPITITNVSGSADTLYYRLHDRDRAASTFIGDATALLALADGLLIIGESVALNAGLGSIDVAVATGDTATITTKMGVSV